MDESIAVLEGELRAAGSAIPVDAATRLMADRKSLRATVAITTISVNRAYGCRARACAVGWGLFSGFNGVGKRGEEEEDDDDEG